MPADRRTDSEFATSIRCLLSDVDGVMTDGRIIYDAAGNETKCFHVRDGLGIKLWIKSGFHFGIVTARTSPMVVRRAAELGITSVSQGCSDKWAEASRMIDTMGLTPDQVAYVGDDIPDLVVMDHVGLSVAPADAASDVHEAADWILQSRGGDGVIRELVERLLRAGRRWEDLVKQTN